MLLRANEPATMDCSLSECVIVFSVLLHKIIRYIHEE